MQAPSLYPEPETGALVTWLTEQLYTPPEDWKSIAVSLVSHEIPGGYSVSTLAYDQIGQPAPLSRNAAEVERPDGYPTPFQKWLAAATNTPVDKVPQRAVLVQIIRHNDTKPEVRIQIEAEDLEKWDYLRHRKNLAEALRPVTG